jgi:hypothetical protein
VIEREDTEKVFERIERDYAVLAKASAACPRKNGA